MASDDDIERLLREVEALKSGPPPAQPPARQEKAIAQPKESKRLVWGAVAAVGGGAAGFLIGTLLGFLPWVSSMSTAVGAALGAFLVALISGPPGWFGGKG